MDENISSVIGTSIVAELTAIVGRDGLVVDPSAVEADTRTSIPYRQIPDCLVYPRSTAEVQAIVALARKHGIKVYPVSTGRNGGYGERSASDPGGITRLLERMKRIDVVDPVLGYALIEPGVTYRELDDHLKRHAPSLWCDCAGSTASASVLGNALDKGRGLTPYADHFGALCGMEVVLADGSLVRTGNLTDTPNRVWNAIRAAQS